MRTDEFDYVLPPGRIASRPAEPRDAARLLTVDRATGGLEDRHFRDLPELLEPGDLVVLNDTRVFPARLLGHKPTGAAAEILLTRACGPGEEPAREWEALVRPGGKLKPGSRVLIGPGLEVEILDGAPAGGRRVRLRGEGSPWDLIDRFGHMPLPPYIERGDDAADRSDYQTVYAAEPGSVAAPTAGLHFTEALLGRLRASGVEIARLTLHVGVGTFRPVRAERVEDHRLHAEWYRLGAGCAAAVRAARARGARICAVGTTVCRTLETVGPEPEASEGWADLFIHPPYRFRVVTGLITNFHLPRSSLLMLVGAFAGLDTMRAAYAHALENGYRFYSYGDAMWIR